MEGTVLRFAAVVGLLAFLGCGNTDDDPDFPNAFTIRASLPFNAGSRNTEANGNSGGLKDSDDTRRIHVSISDDGRFIAFASDASNLTAESSNSKRQVFLRDLDEQKTVLVSRSTTGSGGNDTSEMPRISGDGKFVAFESKATDLAGTTSGRTHIYRWKRETGALELVSKASGGGEGGAAGDGLSQNPSISRDGTKVAFDSGMTDLAAGDSGGFTDVFVRDLSGAGVTTLESKSTSGTIGNEKSRRPSISPDGAFAAFETLATNFDGLDVDSRWDVYVRKLTSTQTTTLVSRASGGGAKGGSDSFWPTLSENGSFVAFESDATNLVSDDANAVRDLFVRGDLAAASPVTERVSIGDGGNEAGFGLDSVSTAARQRLGTISSDARYVVFESFATNLVNDDRNAVADVFIRDRVAGHTRRVSVGTLGTETNERSGSAAISLSGRFVAFSSFASNLVDSDTNGAADIFRRGPDP